MRKSLSGFTIIELLVIIIIVGVLAAISIVSYNFIINDTHDAAVQSDLRNFRIKAERFYMKNNLYPSATNTGLGSLEWTATTDSYASGWNLQYHTDASILKNYILFGRSKSGKIFYVTNDSSSIREAESGYKNFVFRGTTWPSRNSEFDNSVASWPGMTPGSDGSDHLLYPWIKGKTS